MDWEKLSKSNKRRFTHLIVLYEEIDILSGKKQTAVIKHALQVLRDRVKEVRNSID